MDEGTSQSTSAVQLEKRPASAEPEESRNESHGGSAHKKAKMASSDEYTLASERDVGITEFVSSGLPAVQGIIKQRFTDFQVFEITPTGSVCRIEDFGPPQPPQTVVGEVDESLRAQLDRELSERNDVTGALRKERIDREQDAKAQLKAQRDADRLRAQQQEFKWEADDVDLEREGELVDIVGEEVRNDIRTLWEQGPNGFEKVELPAADAVTDDSPSQQDRSRDSGRGGRGGRGARGGRGGRGGGRGGRPAGNGDPRKVVTRPLESKDVRAKLHQVVREMFKGRLLTETVEHKAPKQDGAAQDNDDDALINSEAKSAQPTPSTPAPLPSSIGIRWNPNPQGKDPRSMGAASRNAGEASLPPYIHFHLQKTNRDQQDAFNLLARALNLGGGGPNVNLNRIASKELTVAGTKDKRGVTVQRVSLRRGRKTAEDVWKAVNGIGRDNSDGHGGRGGGRGGRGGRGGGRFGGHSGSRKTLVDAVTSRGERGLRVGHFSYNERPLFLGDLSGNRFVIVLRNLKVDHEDTVHKALGVLRAQGFINYYGMQRFGTSSLSSHQVGLPLIRHDFETAVKLLLAVREDDTEEVYTAKELYAQGQVKDAFQLMPRWASAERAILGKMLDEEKRNGQGCKHNDWQAYFMAIPKGLRTMYMHAYQSFLWNHVASERVKRFGLEAPVAGDAVYVDASRDADEDGGEGSPDAEGAEDEPTDKVADEQGKAATGRRMPALPAVKYLTEEEAASGKWTIHDVVIASPGAEVTVPAGSWMRTYQENLMSADGLSLAELETPSKGSDVTLRGAYRKLLHRPSNVSYEFIRYTDTELPLNQSDEDRLLGIDEVPQSFATIKEADEDEAAQRKRRAEAEASVNAGEGDAVSQDDSEQPPSFLALKVSFDLGTAAYATMALREITKVDTSSAHQKSLTEASEDRKQPLRRGAAGAHGAAVPQPNWLGVTARKGEKVNEIAATGGRKQRVWGAPAALPASEPSSSDQRAAIDAQAEGKENSSTTNAADAALMTTTVSDAFKQEMSALQNGEQSAESTNEGGDVQDDDALANM